MLLGESDIAKIIDHLGGQVQFYDANGLHANMGVLREIRNALRSYVGTSASKSAERFELVTATLVEVLKQTDLRLGTVIVPKSRARLIVELADVVLAAMDKTPDTGPSAETEKPVSPDLPSAIVQRVRQRIQAALTLEQLGFSQNPAIGSKTIECRDEFVRGMERALNIVRAMEETGEAENA